MAGKWSAKDRRQLVWTLVFMGVAILFVLVATTPVQRRAAFAFAVLCALGAARSVLPLLRLRRERKVSEEVAQQQAFQRLARARVKEIVGLVDSGIYGLDRPVRDSGPCFTMSAWRIKNGRLRKERIFVDRHAAGLRSVGSPTVIPAYSVLRFRARLRTSFLGMSEMLLEEIIGIETSDAGLNRVRELLNIVSVEDPVIGAFIQGKSGDAWFGVSTWMGSGVSVTLNLGEDGSANTLRESLEVAHLLWQNQEAWNQKIRDFAVKTMLREKNEDLGENQKPLTARQFEEGMELDDIEVFPNSDFRFGYDHSDMSPADGFVVAGNLSEGVKEAYLSGM